MSAIAPSVSERAAAAAGPPLDDEAFAGLIADLGPFEHRPRLAVAVSGGADSMALCLLADRFARARDGAATALIVDHGLRPGSVAEAAQVEAWLAARGIARQVLAWQGPKPATGLQAAARTARYDLLTGWCRRHAVLHLLLGHHREDQAETVAFRHARQSGPDGLAGMAAVREIEGLRLLRPLLAVPRARLRATLEAEGQDWIEDPSNRAPEFARSRLRAARLDSDRLVAFAAAMAARRRALDRRAAAILAEAARIDPAGFVTLTCSSLRAAPVELGARVLQQALGVVGGRPYPPRRERLMRLLAALRADVDPSARTLAGCRVVVRGDAVLICREAAATGAPVTLAAGVWCRFDERFAVRVEPWEPGLVVRALGDGGWRRRRELVAPSGSRPLPPPCGPGLPSIWRDGQLLVVPHLGLVAVSERRLLGRVDVRFRPRLALAGPAFAAPMHASAMSGLLRPRDSLS